MLNNRGHIQQLTSQIGPPRSVLPAGNRCHFVLLDEDESCLTADLSNIGRLNGPAYSTNELLYMPQNKHKNL